MTLQLGFCQWIKQNRVYYEHSSIFCTGRGNDPEQQGIYTSFLLGLFNKCFYIFCLYHCILLVFSGG